nr:MAG: portal protein [Lokiarchaeota virus Ratatoskr Meg22_1012]
MSDVELTPQQLLSFRNGDFDFYIIEEKREPHYLEKLNVFSSDIFFNDRSVSFELYIKENRDLISEKIKNSTVELNERISKTFFLREIMELKENEYDNYNSYFSKHEYYDLIQLKHKFKLIQNESIQRFVNKPKINRTKITTLQPHPINLDVIKKIIKREPIVNAAIEERAYKTMQPGFQIECNNKDAKRELIDFTENSRIKFHEHMTNAILNYLSYGNEFLQPVVFDNEIIKLFHNDPQYMFVETDEQRNVFGYWEFSSYRQEYFFPDEIIHWKRGATIEDPYGYSVIHPLVETIKRKLNVWADAMKTLHRYGSPIILWIFGNEAIPRMPKEKITSFISNLKTHPSSDIGVPYGVDGKTLGSDFKVALNFTPYFEEIRDEILGTIRTPAVALGLGKSDAKSRENLEEFDMHNQTLQNLLTTNIILPLLRLQLNLKGMGRRKVKNLNIRWNRFERIERDKKEQNLVKMQAIGMITPNEARRMIGLTEPIKAYDPIEKKEIKNYGDMFIYPIQQQQNTTNSLGQRFNSNKVNPPTDKTKQKGKVTKQ